jgi:purine-binding chemotaxis protein CheW
MTRLPPDLTHPLTMPDSKQYATFTLDGLFLGIEVRQVQEVIRYQEMTRVPLAPTMIQGLINLRGQIVTAIDLRRRLDLPPRPTGQLPMNVVVRSEDGAISLLVDEIGDVVELPDEAYETPPDTLRGIARELVTGVYKLPGRLLLILDTERTVTLPIGYGKTAALTECATATASLIPSTIS